MLALGLGKVGRNCDFNIARPPCWQHTGPFKEGFYTFRAGDDQGGAEKQSSLGGVPEVFIGKWPPHPAVRPISRSDRVAEGVEETEEPQGRQSAEEMLPWTQLMGTLGLVERLGAK